MSNQVKSESAALINAMIGTGLTARPGGRLKRLKMRQGARRFIDANVGAVPPTQGRVSEGWWSKYNVGDRVIYQMATGEDKHGKIISCEPHGYYTIACQDDWIFPALSQYLRLDAEYYELRGDLDDRLKELGESRPQFKIGDRVIGIYGRANVIVLPRRAGEYYVLRNEHGLTWAAPAVDMQLDTEDEDFKDELKDRLDQLGEALKFKVGDHVVHGGRDGQAYHGVIKSIPRDPDTALGLAGLYGVESGNMIWYLKDTELMFDRDHYQEIEGELHDRLGELEP